VTVAEFCVESRDTSGGTDSRKISSVIVSGSTKIRTGPFTDPNQTLCRFIQIA